MFLWVLLSPWVHELTTDCPYVVGRLHTAHTNPPLWSTGTLWGETTLCPLQGERFKKHLIRLLAWLHFSPGGAGGGFTDFIPIRASPIKHSWEQSGNPMCSLLLYNFICSLQYSVACQGLCRWIIRLGGVCTLFMQWLCNYLPFETVHEGVSSVMVHPYMRIVKVLLFWWFPDLV